MQEPGGLRGPEGGGRVRVRGAQQSPIPSLPASGRGWGGSVPDGFADQHPQTLTSREAPTCGRSPGAQARPQLHWSGRATHHADLGADEHVGHGARDPARLPTWASGLPPTPALGLQDCHRHPESLPFWPLAMPTPQCSWSDRSGVQSGAGTRDAPPAPVTQGPPLPPGRAHRGCRLWGAAPVLVAWKLG